MKKEEGPLVGGDSGKSKRQIFFNKSVPSQIFEFLRDEIIGLELTPGTLISETSLADKFGVSRTPIREALFKLSNLGFVEVRPQRGTYVTQLSISKILEARFIREALEVAVASQLAEQPDKDLIQSCEKIIREQEVAAADHSPILFQRLDDEFHQSLASHVSYPRVASVIEAEKGHMDRVRNLSLQTLTGQYDRVLTQHKAILAAIGAGSTEQSAESMRIHMNDILYILELAPKNHPEYFTDEPS